MSTALLSAYPVVGVDLVDVRQVEASVRRYGDAYLDRVYTPREAAYARESESEQHRRLAARFAAKEATLKILRPEGRWLDWRLIEVIRNQHGHCELVLHGDADQLATQRGINSLSVSLSHENEMAIAVVVGVQVRDAPSAARFLSMKQTRDDGHGDG